MTKTRVLAFCAVVAGACGDDGGGTTDCGTTGTGTDHAGVVSADETWAAADGPHNVVNDVTIVGARVTIEPCAVVRLERGYAIIMGGGNPDDQDAALIAHGTSTQPITFERHAADDPWGFILTYASGFIDFEYVTLRGGGDPVTAPNNGGTIIASGLGGNTGLTANVRLVDVTIEDSGGFGVNLRDRTAFAVDSARLVVEGAAGAPISINGPAVGSIPVGTYTGNATDEILVHSAGSLLDPEITFPRRFVPYHMETELSMAPAMPASQGGLSTLTIEGGVTILFDKSVSTSWRLVLGTSNGAAPENVWPVRLRAEATADAPIVLTSAEATPAAGDWGGIAWGGGPADGNVMTNVRVEYAGGESGTSYFGCGPGDNDAALIITNWRPENAFITSSTFSDSASGGIVSGWSTDAGGPNLGPGNTFTNIANGCNVSRWADGNGSCPGTPPLCL